MKGNIDTDIIAVITVISKLITRFTKLTTRIAKLTTRITKLTTRITKCRKIRKMGGRRSLIITTIIIGIIIDTHPLPCITTELSRKGSSWNQGCVLEH